MRRVQLSAVTRAAPEQAATANSRVEGIRLDLSLCAVLAACARKPLADLGADVIKIERLGAGDDTRNWGSAFRPRPMAARIARIGVLPGRQPQQALGYLRHRAA